MNKKAKILISILVLLLVGVFSFGEINLYLETKKGMQGKAITQAKVTGVSTVEKIRKGRVITRDIEDFEYFVEGVAYQGGYNSSDKEIYGSEFNVIYSINNPKEHQVEGMLRKISTITELFQNLLMMLLKFGLLGLIVGYGISSKLGWTKTDEATSPKVEAS